MKVAGRRRKKRYSWVSTESWRKIDERRKLKKKIERKEATRSLYKDKRSWINSDAHEADDAAEQGQIKGVYVATRMLCNEGPTKVGMVKKKKGGRLLTKQDEIKARWQEHFMEVLNRPVPGVVAKVDEINVVSDNTVIREITREEIKSALGDMKSGEAPVINNISADLLKAVNIRHGPFNIQGSLRTGSDSLSSRYPRKGI